MQPNRVFIETLTPFTSFRESGRLLVCPGTNLVYEKQDA